MDKSEQNSKHKYFNIFNCKKKFKKKKLKNGSVNSEKCTLNYNYLYNNNLTKVNKVIY